MAIILKASAIKSVIPDMRCSSSILDVARAMEVAFKYRNFFRKDIIVDLIVYRRW